MLLIYAVLMYLALCLKVSMIVTMVFIVDIIIIGIMGAVFFSVIRWLFNKIWRKEQGNF